MIANPIIHPSIFRRRAVVSVGGTGAGDAWSTQVVANGGATPSSTNVTAINTFWSGLQSSGSLVGKIYQINLLAPDSLIAALTPLTVANTGSLLWVNHGVLSGDVSTAGVAFSGANDIWANTGVSGSLIDANNQGLTIIGSDSNSSIVGANNSSDGYSWAIRYANSNGNSFYESFYPNTRLNQMVTDAFGFISGNRTGATTANVYWGDNAHALATVGSTSTGPVSAGPGNTVGVGGCPTSTGTLTEKNTGRMSLVVIHQGFTSAEATNLFNAVKILRNSFGGGWV